MGENRVIGSLSCRDHWKVQKETKIKVSILWKKLRKDNNTDTFSDKVMMDTFVIAMD